MSDVLIVSRGGSVFRHGGVMFGGLRLTACFEAPCKNRGRFFGSVPPSAVEPRDVSAGTPALLGTSLAGTRTRCDALSGACTFGEIRPPRAASSTPSPRGKERTQAHRSLKKLFQKVIYTHGEGVYAMPTRACAHRAAGRPVMSLASPCHVYCHVPHAPFSPRARRPAAAAGACRLS